MSPTWRCAWCHTPREPGVEYTDGICREHRRADFLAPIVHGVIARMRTVGWHLSDETRREMAAELERVARALEREGGA